MAMAFSSRQTFTSRDEGVPGGANTCTFARLSALIRPATKCSADCFATYGVTATRHY